MNTAPYADIAVFTEALPLPLEERDRYLSEACKGDAECRLRVEALLRADNRQRVAIRGKTDH